MPLYEYECQSCGRRFEVIQKFSDAPVVGCEVCGGAVQKLAASPAIQFKGTGWYITDYARKSSGGNGNREASKDSSNPSASSSPSSSSSTSTDAGSASSSPKTDKSSD